jgi:hypothetical protein
VVYLNKVLHNVLGRNCVWSWNRVALNTPASVNGSNNISSSHLRPILEFGVLNIDEVIKHCTFAWEFDDFTLLALPPFVKELSVVFAIFLTKSSSDTPDASEDKDPLNALNFIVG